MEIQAAQATSALKGALEQQQLGASLISSTVDRLNSGMKGLTPVINSDYVMQKSIMSAAYAAKGIGTGLDLRV